MNDDWRLRIDLHEHGLARRLGEALAADELEHDLQSTFQDRVVVSVDGPQVFCYAGTREQAQAAERLVRRLAGEHGWELDAELTRWHPLAERWEDPDTPLPTDAEEAQAERAQRVAAEREESAAQGYPEYEVRVRCDSRHEAGALAERLRAEGIPNLHRWSWVLIGATDEDSAEALAARLRDEVASDDPVTVEHNQRAVYEDRPWSPFTVLGGLAG